MKRVFGSYNQTIVYHAKNLLEGQGIDVLVRNAALSSAVGELPATETEVWVLNDEDLDRAQASLRQNFSGPDWTCSCGEKLGPQFTHCWRCNAERP